MGIDSIRSAGGQGTVILAVKAIDKAIDRCIQEGVLREFLTKRREEVTKVTQLNYTFDRRIELEREDAREEERVNTERERKAKEEALLEKEKERLEKEEALLEKEKERLEKEEALLEKELAEQEVRKLRAELERYKRQFPEAERDERKV